VTVESAETKLRLARVYAQMKLPYLSCALWRMRFFELDEEKVAQSELPPGFTIGVSDNLVVYYLPEVAEKYTTEELGGILCHEAWHVLRGHSARREERDCGLWNIAADMEINDDLSREIRLPSDGVHPDNFNFDRDQTAEVYYAALDNMAKSGQGQEGGGVTSGCCGSCATGVPEGYEDQEMESESAMSDVEKQTIRATVAREMSKDRGTKSAYDEWIAEVLGVPKLPWRRLLSRRLKATITELNGASDYTWMRPNPRYDNGEFILPVPCSHSQSIAVVLDTSGSMTEEIGDALNEIAGITDGSPHRAWLVQCDAEVKSVEPLTRRLLRSPVTLRGGGGTDMRVGIAECEEIRPEVQLIIVITDGYSPFPKERPKTDVLCILTPYGDQRYVPTWMDVIQIESNQ